MKSDGRRIVEFFEPAAEFRQRKTLPIQHLAQSGIYHNFQFPGHGLPLRTVIYRQAPKIIRLPVAAYNAPLHIAERQTDFDRDRKGAKMKFFTGKHIAGDDGRLYESGSSNAGAVGRKNGREGVSGKVRNEAAPAIHQAHQWTKNVVQRLRELFGAARPLRHEGFGEGREARHVHKHGISLHAPVGFACKTLILNEMWNKIFHRHDMVAGRK